jgi:hypothetical protein
MRPTTLFASIVTGLCALGLLASAAAPTVSAAPDAQARTRTPGNIAATATALRATANAAATAIKATATTVRATAQPTRLPNEEAAEAIQTYAEEVLGISVTIKKAGGFSSTFIRDQVQIPKGSTAQSATVKLALKNYGAVLSNGAATLSYGSGTVSGDITVDVQASSLGVYSLVVASAGTLDANSALTLAKATFPGLEDLTYTAYTTTKGFAWYAKGSVTVIDPKTRKAVTTSQVAVFYVLPGTNGKANVSATVGRGEFAKTLKVP